jgi:uncharacterized membrane protein
LSFPHSSGRLPAIDIARGIALIGMVVFHVTLDLEMFGVVAPGTIVSPGWVVFARLVAGAFIFLAGVSLVLAHGQGIRWRHFVRGTGVVALGASAVSVATVIAMPWVWIFFGILHSIAVSRVLGLAFLRAPVWLMIAVGLAVWAAPYLWQSDIFNTRWLAWIGFSTLQPPSMDLEPVFPWFGPFLLGMATARLGLVPGWSWPGAAGRALAWAGRHSLWIYLAHQPLILGALWFYFVGLRA